MNLIDDQRYMRRALRLAGLGCHSSPNPMVGCVLVQSDGTIVGEGYHHAPGGPHAEAWALQSAGTAAAGTTAFVTLEPCSFFGRTPPCADALIAANVSHVVVAMQDPDARVSGNGIARLRSAGITVSVGCLEAEARALNAAYITHRTTARPWLVLKSAMTLDGKIATASGDSQWISSPISRAAVHRQLRDRCDAILCGVDTIIADNPQLTTRLRRGGRNPWRIIVDSRGRTPISARAAQMAADDGRTIIATTGEMPDRTLETFAAGGCRIIVCDKSEDGRVSLPDLMARLGTRGDIIGVLAEGGAKLSAALFEHKLVDRWLVYIAPKVIGGQKAPGPVGGEGVLHMSDAVLSRQWRVRRSGPDMVIDARFG